MNKYTGVGRAELIERIIELEDELFELKKQREAHIESMAELIRIYEERISELSKVNAK